MHYFQYRNNELYCEKKKVIDIAKEFGTPLYLYSYRTITEHFDKIKRAFSCLDPLICYSVKANSNLTILKILVERGAGLDIVSGGELFRARLVKCPPKRIVYASVGKTEKEIKEAIDYGILLFNVESLPELVRINKLAKSLNKKVDVALRFNPDISSSTHRYIVTGKKETKFGMDIDSIKHIFSSWDNYSSINLKGLHIHIGSQITQAEPFIRAIKRVKNIMDELAKDGIYLDYLNIGGGLGIVYSEEKPQSAQDFADKVLPLLKGMNFKLILEPGRFIVGNAGILVTKVIYIKDTPIKRFIIVDAAMNDLIRPALYGAFHRIEPLRKRADVFEKKLSDIVGPVCESGDFLGKDRELNVKEGDYLVVFGAGAYGFSMSSNYNSRPRAREVLVKGNRTYLIRERETYQDLVRKERIVSI
ncbi:MAG: diaminopimelate decarboxylase [Candidatus Omnitrophica bacterium]|nr:diaminopimelate decarboxylase [Candidatus Omnitrophota bacterium]MCM8825943.1 diaminopimelate decarboxylase [Candidatus Omnitrophota bacterium]